MTLYSADQDQTDVSVGDGSGGRLFAVKRTALGYEKLGLISAKDDPMSMKYSARAILMLLLFAVVAVGAFAWRAVDAVSQNQLSGLEWTLVPVAEREIAFRVPVGWSEQAPEIAYADRQAALTLGLDHGIIIPARHTPTLLPDGYDMVESGNINLGWAQGTRYVLQNAGGAQIRIVAQVDENVYAFYLSGRSLNQVEAHEVLLAEMVNSVILAENTPEGFAIFNP